MVDFNSDSSFSKTVMMNELRNQDVMVFLAPNHVGNDIQIRFIQCARQLKYKRQVQDLAVRNVLSKELSSQDKIFSLSGLIRGTSVFKIYDQNQELLHVETMIIQ
ncbi:MAG: hypothetical protein WBP58_08950 [Chitinophagaceae bacterium]